MVHAPATAHGAVAASDVLERETMVRVRRRLIPLLFLCYYAAFLDRVNVGFSALTMNKALGFSNAVFGFGSGIFFVGYFLFEIPSNLILAKVGARRWIARILLTWGIISGLTAFVWNAPSFYAIRFLLGLAEAGFYPGIILFLTWWVPCAYRSRMIAQFMTAIPVAVMSGSIISGYILELDGALGLQGWQWLFLIEALPAVVLSAVVYLCLTDTPSDAAWLPMVQRDWLVKRLDAERAQRESIRHYGLSEAMRNPRVWAFTLIYFGQATTGYGFTLFLPQIIKRFGLTNVQTGFVTAVPYLAGLIALVLWSWHSDHTGERSKHCAAACLTGAAGLIACLSLNQPVLMMVALTIAQMGLASIPPTFWPLPTAMLSGAAAAGGIALINAVGNLGGFLGPYTMGLIQDATGSFTLGLVAIATASVVSGVVVLVLGHDRRLEQVPPLPV